MDQFYVVQRRILVYNIKKNPPSLKSTDQIQLSLKITTETHCYIGMSETWLYWLLAQHSSALR